MSRTHHAMVVASAGQPPRLVMVPRDDGGAEYARRLIASAHRAPAQVRADLIGRIERVRAARDAQRRRLVHRPASLTAAASKGCRRCDVFRARGWHGCPFHTH